MVAIFAVLSAVTLAVIVVGQVQAAREEAERIRRETEELREKHAPEEFRSEYR
jgi:hypothetical protein